MKDQDDLFEFGDFDDESLELNLDDLFGDLDVLSFDPNQLEAPATEPVESVPTSAAPAPKPATPKPAPVASAPQPAAQAAFVAPQPVAAAQLPPGQVYYAPTPTKSSRLQLATIAIAAIVTLANFAVMALPKAGNQNAQERTSSVALQAPNETRNDDLASSNAPSAADLALIARIQQLESQLQTINTPTDATPSTPNQRHRAFDEIEAQIASGDFQAARGRLYSLLAVVDRFDAVRAREIEDQASYLLADTYRLEAEAQEHNL